MRRFQKRMNDRTRSWKLSPMDVESRSRWVDYSRAKDTMFAHTDIKQAPWYVVKADNKKLARLNCITHLLSMVEYGDLTPTPPSLPPRPKADDYVRPPLEDQTFIPDYRKGPRLCAQASGQGGAFGSGKDDRSFGAARSKANLSSRLWRVSRG